MSRATIYAYVGGNPTSFIDPSGLVKHTTGRTIQCGKGCTIRIDYTFNESTGEKVRHLHWECRGREGTCGEDGADSHGEDWDSAPQSIKECALRNGFNGAAAPAPDPSSQNNSNFTNILTGAGIGIGIGIGVTLAPEITIPALLFGGALAQ